MQSPAEVTSSRFLKLPMLALIGLGVITPGLFLLPSPARIHERIEKCRVCARITPFLAEARFEGGLSPAEALMTLPVAHLDTLDHLSQLPPHEQLSRIFDPKKTLKYDEFIHAFTLAAVHNADAIAPAHAFALIEPKSQEIPEKERLEVFHAIVTRAHAASQHGLAAEILRRSCRASTSTWITVKDMIVASRASGSQAKAVEELRQWMKGHKSSLVPAQLVEAGMLRYSLALEAGLPSEALDECLGELNRQPGITTISPDLMERMHRAAVLAERAREILPWIESYLASFPDAALSWQELVEASPSDAYKQWVKRAADIADSCLLADKAYAHHQRLVAMGDTSCLDRLLPLSTHLGRSEETAQIMQAIGQRPGNERLPLESARVMALHGQSGRAAGMFEEWIAKHPQDRDAAYELACMKEAGSSSTDAAAAFEAFLRAFPGDAAAVKKLASLRIRNGQPQSALRELDGLRETDFDARTLENYTLLAESLDRPVSLQRALRISSNDPSRATPALFIRMAEIAQRTGQDAEAPLLVLRDGIKRLPQSPSLRVKLASLLLEKEKFAQALAEALHPVVKARQDALSIALAAAVHTNRCAEALAAAGADFEKNDNLSTSTLLDFAAACCIAGDTTRGQAVFASVRPDPSNFARLAEAHLLAGHADQAEIFAKQNVMQNRAPKPADWILLGDAQAMQGRKMEADDAYAKALSVVSHKITTKNFSDAVAAEAATILPAIRP